MHLLSFVREIRVMEKDVHSLVRGQRKTSVKHMAEGMTVGGALQTKSAICTGLAHFLIHVIHPFLRMDILSVTFEKLVLVINKLYQCVLC